MSASKNLSNPKVHVYLFSFYYSPPEKTHELYLNLRISFSGKNLKDKNLTYAMEECASRMMLDNIKRIVILSVSYLGHMTKEEFEED